MNSLRVDIILESERRSASPVSLKAAAKIIGGLVLTLLVAGVLIYIINAQSAKRRRADIEQDWERTSKIEARIRGDQKDLDWLNDVHAEIEGWKQARMLWHQHLADFQALVPPNIQITSFQVDEQIPTTGTGARLTSMRAFTLNLQGRAEGDNPRGAVDGFLTALRQGAGFSNLVEEAKVLKIDTNPLDKTNHRIFTILVKYKARSF
ncbi:MAG: hypothetical protein WCL44_07965 [bacterium]